MSISVQVRSIDLSKAEAKGKKYEDAVKAAVSAAVLTDSTPYVPYLTHALRQSGERNTRYTEGLVIWGDSSVPYARVQYEKYPHKRMPGTEMKWFEVAKKARINSWVKVAQQAVKAVS